MIRIRFALREDYIFSLTPAQVNKALVGLAHERLDGIGVIDAAILVGMAPPIAREQLLAAEAQGALCRDEAPDGLRFFANRFGNAT